MDDRKSMGLAEVREKINDIDARLSILLDERAECSVGVAAAKLGSGDLIYKPEREREICDKFANAGKGMGANVVKTIMRNSRLIQYEMYVNEGLVPEKFVEMMKDAGDGVNLSVEISFDDDDEKKLSKSDILSVLAESGFEIKKLELSEDTVRVTLLIGAGAEQRRKAYILLFMLYTETCELAVIDDDYA